MKIQEGELIEAEAWELQGPPRSAAGLTGGRGAAASAPLTTPTTEGPSRATARYDEPSIEELVRMNSVALEQEILRLIEIDPDCVDFPPDFEHIRNGKLNCCLHCL